jgi:hypothetical protein
LVWDTTERRNKGPGKPGKTARSRLEIATSRLVDRAHGSGAGLNDWMISKASIVLSACKDVPREIGRAQLSRQSIDNHSSMVDWSVKYRQTRGFCNLVASVMVGCSLQSLLAGGSCQRRRSCKLTSVAGGLACFCYSFGAGGSRPAANVTPTSTSTSSDNQTFNITSNSGEPSMF